jgi:arylsulfatase A-like enzyme
MTDQNVIVLVLDTARYDTIRSNLDHLSEIASIQNEGTAFRECFSSAAWTLPSHASLFSGVTPSKHGAHAGHKGLGDELTLIAEVFRESGYETVSVSNNTWISEEFGFGRGFEQFRKTWQYVQSDVDFGRIARMNEGLDKFKALGREMFTGNPLVNIANVIYGQFGRDYHDDGAKQTNEWLETWLDDRSDARPFFLFVNYLEPHLEYRPPEAFTEQFLPTGVSYDEAIGVPQDAWQFIAGNIDLSDHQFDIFRGLYRAEIAYLDHRIGELVDHLKAHGEWENTVFVITGDHGENIGDHGLMDHQYCLYDTLLHVPLVIHGGSFTGGETIDDLVQLIDLAPTLLDEVGIEAPGFREQIQGQSFHPGADTDPRDRVIAEYMAPQPSMEALEKRVGTLPESVHEYDRSLRAIRTYEWKLIRGSDGTIELYDINEDPGESENVAGGNEDAVTNLERELDDWLDSFEHADHTGEVPMRDETEQRLEDLGYLQ